MLNTEYSRTGVHLQIELFLMLSFSPMSSSNLLMLKMMHHCNAMHWCTYMLCIFPLSALKYEYWPKSINMNHPLVVQLDNGAWRLRMCVHLTLVLRQWRWCAWPWCIIMRGCKCCVLHIFSDASYMFTWGMIMADVLGKMVRHVPLAVLGAFLELRAFSQLVGGDTK